jgi:Flp pilus assembly pilin Flp
MTHLKALWHSEEGQDLVEYTLLLTFCALTVAALVAGPMSSVNKIWVDANSELSVAVSSVS